MLARLIAVARILMGMVFLVAGISKLVDPGFLYGGLLLELEKYGQPYGFFDRYLISRYVEYHQTLFAYAAAIGEILVGASLLLGALVSLGSLGGVFLVLNFGFAISAGNPGMMALHVAFAVVLLVLGRMGAGLKWGVDDWLTQYLPEAVLLIPLRLSRPSYM